jgi:hypothetical protein
MEQPKVNLLNIGRRLNQQTEAQREADGRRQEVENFNLAKLDTFLSVVKYVVFGLLAILNFRLFWHALPAPFGGIVGAAAVLSECLAVYCWNNQYRAAGLYRKALVSFAVIITLVSFVHAAASFYDLAGLSDVLGRPLFIYSKFVAFPLLFTLMTVAVCTLYATHWSSGVAKQQAAAQEEIQTDRAHMLTRTARLGHQSEQSRAEMEFYRRQIEIEREQLGLLEAAVALEQRKQAALDGITDPRVKKRILDLLSIDEDGNGTPDAFEKPEMRRQLDELRATGGYINGGRDLPN